MARLLGVEIPDNKKVKIALTYIYGIGQVTANMILNLADVDPEKRVKELSGEQLGKISSLIQEKFKVEGALRREVNSNIKRLIDIGSYRGRRHKAGLPARGQRTSCNARTCKGPRKTVGILRKKVKKQIQTTGKKE